MFFPNKRRHADQAVESTKYVMRPWAFVAAIVGLASLVFGVWALVRTGLNTNDLYTPRDQLLGVPYTPAFALGVVGFGVLMLVAAAGHFVGPFLMTILGLAAGVLGAFIVTGTYLRHLNRWMAADDTTGWVLLIVGGLCLAAAAVLPTMTFRRDTVTREHAREVEAPPRHHWWHPTPHGGSPVA